MGAVESNYDRMIRQLRRVLADQPPTEERLHLLLAEATKLKCGFIVERGKPGTLRISPFVPMNTILKINLDKIDDASSLNLPGWERFQ